MEEQTGHEDVAVGDDAGPPADELAADPIADEHASFDESDQVEEGAPPSSGGFQAWLATGLGLLALAVAAGVGSFGTWLHLSLGSQFADQKGLTSWRGTGWMTLLLSIATVVFIVVDLVQASKSTRAVVATLFASMGLIGGYFVVQTTWFPDQARAQPGLGQAAGWGILLCFACGVAGLGLSLVWLAMSDDTALAE